MKNKSNSLANMVRHVELMHARGYNIQKIGTDQGTEYSGSESSEFLRVNGITHALYGLAAHNYM